MADRHSAPVIDFDPEAVPDSPWYQSRINQSRHFATIREVITLKRGLILITGKNASGKTVLLFNALRFAAEQGRSVRVENGLPLEYREPGVRACHSETGDFEEMLTALKAGLPIEEVIGIQTAMRRYVDGVWETMVERLAKLAFMAQQRLVIAEFTLADPLPPRIIQTLNAPLAPQGIPVHALHIGDRAAVDLKAAS